MDSFDPEKTIEAFWVVDSETGDEVLVDSRTNKEIARKYNGAKRGSFDYCKLFANIEKDPHAPVKLTIGQYYGAAEHVKSCQDCRDRAERILADHPEHDGDKGFSAWMN